MRDSAKTNAVRLVASLGIPYQLASYKVGDEHVEAAAVARQLGLPPEILFKTLVARDERANVLVFCVPAAAELDLKKAARAAGAKRVELVGLKDVQPLTGYVRGGCSPIGMKKRYPVFIDETATLTDRLYINAGARGLQIVIAPDDLARACNGAFMDLV